MQVKCQNPDHVCFSSVCDVSLQNKSLAVNHVILSVVKVMAERATHILTSIDVAMTTGPLHTVLSGEEKTDLVNLYRDTVVKVGMEVKVDI